jgi:hypothetical protein
MKKLTENTFSGILSEILHDDDEFKLYELAQSLVNQAIEGDTKAAAIVLDRFEGKLTEKIEVVGDENVVKLVASATDLLKKIRGYQEARIIEPEATEVQVLH